MLFVCLFAYGVVVEFEGIDDVVLWDYTLFLVCVLIFTAFKS
jgi:hypothetical protein